MAEWFALLESNEPHVVEEVKQKFHEQFNIGKDIVFIYMFTLQQIIGMI